MEDSFSYSVMWLSSLVDWTQAWTAGQWLDWTPAWTAGQWLDWTQAWTAGQWLDWTAGQWLIGNVNP